MGDVFRVGLQLTAQLVNTGHQSRGGLYAGGVRLVLGDRNGVSPRVEPAPPLQTHDEQNDDRAAGYADDDRAVRWGE